MSFIVVLAKTIYDRVPGERSCKSKSWIHAEMLASEPTRLVARATSKFAPIALQRRRRFSRAIRSFAIGLQSFNGYRYGYFQFLGKIGEPKRLNILKTQFPPAHQKLLSWRSVLLKPATRRHPDVHRRWDGIFVRSK